MKNRLSHLFKFIKLLRIEPYLILIVIEYALKRIPNHQIIEDKICTLWYNTTDQYCHDLPSNDEHGDGDGHFKSKILIDSAIFGTYKSYLSGATLIWVLFAGAWIDRYANGRRILIFIGITTSIIENVLSIYLSIYWKTSVYYNLLIPTPVLGGYSAIIIAVIHYMTSTTTPKLLSIRFMIYELCMSIGFPIGESLGGFILVQTPLFQTGQIRNYILCYIISLILELLALTWVIFMLNDKVIRKCETEIQMKIQVTNQTEIKPKTDTSADHKNIHPIRLLFDFENIKSMVRTAIKKRPNNIRKQLFFLFASLFIMLIDDTGDGLFDQFVQKVYLWTPDWTSYMKSIAISVHSIATITLVPFLIKVTKLSDVNLAIMGLCMIFVMNILKGSWLSPMAFYLSIPIAPTPDVSKVGVRAYMSKIVGSDEIGKVFSFMFVINTLSPMIYNLILVYVLKYTIDTYPGIIFLVIASFILIPILMLMWISLRCQLSLEQRNNKRGDHGEFTRNERLYQNHEKDKDSNIENNGYESDRDLKALKMDEAYL